MISTSEDVDKESRMNLHSMVGSTSGSIAKECNTLCDDEVRVNGVKNISNIKREKIHKN